MNSISLDRRNFIVKASVVISSAIILLFPFTHYPLLAKIVSPFQALSIPVAILGTIIFMQKILINKPAKLSTNTGVPGTWLAAIIIYATVISFVINRSRVYPLALVLLGIFFMIGTVKLFSLAKLSPEYITKLLYFSTVFICLFAIYQFLGESINLNIAYTGLCTTCIQEGTGFARSSGFTLEPQYLSFILFLPLAVVLMELLSKKKWYGWFMVFLIILSDMLGSSRGGILALAFVLASFVIRALYIKNYKFVKNLLEIVVVGGVTAMMLVFVFGNGNKIYSLERYISHMSVGIIKLGSESKRVEQVQSDLKQQELAKDSNGDDFSYVKDGRGYGQSGSVIYSTQSRLETYTLALKIFKNNLKNLFFGVGIGNFGKMASVYNTAYSAQNTVNNQILQVLVELGIFGFVLFVGLLYATIQAIKSRQPVQVYFVWFVIFGAYFIQLMFFSAPHLLHIWFTVAIAWFMISKNKDLKSYNK